MTFQRARSQQQREARQQAILAAAAVMLTEMPVAQVSLNELSRRAGLAKSNVLRYFESREAVLLELLDVAWRSWLDRLATELDAAVPGRATADERVNQVADALAGSLAAEPVLCDLLNAQAAVLERNVSPQVAARYKRMALANVAALGALLARQLPGLGQQDAFRLSGAVLMMTAALWPHTQPSAAMLAAYQADPELAAMRLDFRTTLGEAAALLIRGQLARPRRRAPRSPGLARGGALG